MNITDEAKQAFMDSSVPKELYITFPNINLTVDMEHIIYESMTLKESVLESGSIEFVGCISSEFSISLYGITQDLKGQRIIVRIEAGDTGAFNLFDGIVDSVELEANHNKRKITCYDILYKAGNVEVAGWYNRLAFPMTLGRLRESLFNYIGLPVMYTELPNDGIIITRQYNPTTLQSISVIKAICQINGVFGIVNRNGIFEYRVLTEISDDSVPGATLYPPFLPGSASSTPGPETQFISHYRGFDYQEFTVKPVDKLTIRQSDTEIGISYGSGTNNYIIQGNIFTYGLDDEVKIQIAKNIYPNICGIVYRPFESDNDGLPWLEVGVDHVSYYAYDYVQEEYTERQFYMFNRTLTGLQCLKDSYNADGEQDQRQFLTDLNTRLNAIRSSIRDEIEEIIEDPETIEPIIEPILEDFTYPKEELDPIFGNIDDRLTELEEGGTGDIRVISTNNPPQNANAGVIYLIQSEVVVISS